MFKIFKIWKALDELFMYLANDLIYQINKKNIGVSLDNHIYYLFIDDKSLYKNILFNRLSRRELIYRKNSKALKILLNQQIDKVTLREFDLIMKLYISKSEKDKSDWLCYELGKSIDTLCKYGTGQERI